ncbi:MAG: hypothetical protein J0M02_07745 [Planctomycetes bacterium]|nr:hypothetical protein [Planctomycetota bacterium]
MRSEFGRILRFACSGAGILLAALGINALLVHAGVHTWIAYGITMAVQLALGFAANQLLVFRERRTTPRLVAAYLAAASGFRLADWIIYVTVTSLLPAIPLAVVQFTNAVVLQAGKYLVYRVMFTNRSAGQEAAG